MKNLQILHLFTSDYHSGQWSRGYRLLCMTSKRLRRYFGSRFYWLDSERYTKELRESELYKHLELTYASKM